MTRTRISKKLKKGGNIAVAISIIVAGLIIAGAVVFTQDNDGQINDDTSGDQVATDGDINAITDPNDSDHIKGSLDAKVVIIEYSDTECPFCGRLHATLNQVVNDYDDADVAWIYRHLPLTQLHSKAVVEAHALECAGELGGNDGFWAYTDYLYENTPGNNRLDLDELPNFAEIVGLDRAAFEECMESERHIEGIESDYTEAVTAAGSQLGTPFNVVVLPDGTKTQVSGAQPYEVWKGIIDNAIAE
jgi:protein-disulfide isomerase